MKKSLLTPRGVGVAKAALILAAFSWLTHLPLFTLAATIILLLLALEALHAVLVARSIRKGLKARWQLGRDSWLVGQRQVLQLVLENRSRFNTPSLYLRPRVAPLAFRDEVVGPVRLRAGGVLELTLEATPLEHERLALGPLEVFHTDPLHLYAHRWRLEPALDLRILPKPQAALLLPARTPPQARAVGGRPTGREGMGTEFYEIREYSPGDDYRSISWKAMARMPDHRPMTTRRELERAHQVVVAIANTPSMEEGAPGRRKVVVAVEGALGLAQVAVEEGDRFTVAHFTWEGRPNLYRCSTRDPLVEAVHYLYTVRGAGVEGDVRALLRHIAQLVEPPSLLFFIVDTGHLDHDISLLLRRLQLGGHRPFLAILPTGRFEPPRDEGLVGEVEEVAAALEEVIARRIVEACRALGVGAEICGPGELVQVLQRRYFMMKGGFAR